MDEALSLSEFTLDDFRIELMNYLEANKEALKGSPLGCMRWCRPERAEDRIFQRRREIIRPGVIFCLRHEEAADDDRRKSVNPLSPYYLVYVRDEAKSAMALSTPQS